MKETRESHLVKKEKESGLKLENNSSIHAGQWDEADKIPELTYNIPMQIHYTN